MSKEIEKYFSAVGFTFPENESELLAFDKENEGYEYKLKENSIDPFEILKEIKIEQSKITKVDYHKRTVLAAEIVFKLKDDYSLGHLKLQKLIFLCQNTTDMALHTSFLRQAMGPYDPVLMRSLDSQFIKNKWFKYNREGYPKYIPLEKCGDHEEWFKRYFNNQLSEIDILIETFRDLKTNQVELVATLYACWQKAKDNNSIISNQLLIQLVYKWHKSKKDKFNETQIENAISWMKEKGIHPC